MFVSPATGRFRGLLIVVAGSQQASCRNADRVVGRRSGLINSVN